MRRYKNIKNSDLNLVDDTVVVSVVCDERTLGWESWLPLKWTHGLKTLN
jgi:hypothetical protein